MCTCTTWIGCSEVCARYLTPVSPLYRRTPKNRGHCHHVHSGLDASATYRRCVPVIGDGGVVAFPCRHGLDLPEEMHRQFVCRVRTAILAPVVFVKGSVREQLGPQRRHAQRPKSMPYRLAANPVELQKNWSSQKTRQDRFDQDICPFIAIPAARMFDLSLLSPCLSAGRNLIFFCVGGHIPLTVKLVRIRVMLKVCGFEICTFEAGSRTNFRHLGSFSWVWGTPPLLKQ